MDATAPVPARLLKGRKLSLIRVVWWILFVLYTTFTVFALWRRLIVIQEQVNPSVVYRYFSAVYVTIDVISLCLALILFLKKSNDWAIILVSMMFLSSESAEAFWLWIFNHGWGDSFVLSLRAVRISQIIAQPFDILAAIISVGVFLTFPEGRWISLKAKRLFWANVIFLILINLFLDVIILSQFSEAQYRATNLWRFVYSVESLGVTLFSLFAGYLLFVHYSNMQNSIQRQQIKWIVTFFIGSVCAAALISLYNARSQLLYIFAPQANYLEFMEYIGPWIPLSSSILNLGLVIAFSVAIFRYRLWDVDVFINKTLVYSSLTALLGGLFLISVALIDYAIKEWLGKEPSFWSVVISALPVATVFNPLRDAIQRWVDRYFKPEEVNFSDTFIEFTPSVREKLAISRIVQIISDQAKKQLNVDFAKIYLFEEDNLHQAESARTSDKDKKLILEDKSLTKLKEGKLVVEDDGIPYSLLVPLVVPRARIPDFLGVLMLGRRLEGKGYSTQILKNLQALGADAGKAIYLSQLSEQAKKKKNRTNK